MSADETWAQATNKRAGIPYRDEMIAELDAENARLCGELAAEREQLAQLRTDLLGLCPCARGGEPDRCPVHGSMAEFTREVEGLRAVGGASLYVLAADPLRFTELCSRLNVLRKVILGVDPRFAGIIDDTEGFNRLVRDTLGRERL